MISEKKLFRQDIRRKLDELTTHELETLSSALSINLFRFLNQENAFAPFEKEPLWYKSFDVEKLNLCFPTIKEIPSNNFPQMVFRKSKMNDLLLRSDFGVKILGPKEENQIIIPDLILVPGLAFTLKGERLGRGKGYFDQYLENYKGMKVAIGFEKQLFLKIPVEAHDMKYDWLITEKNIYKI